MCVFGIKGTEKLNYYDIVLCPCPLSTVMCRAGEGPKSRWDTEVTNKTFIKKKKKNELKETNCWQKGKNIVARSRVDTVRLKRRNKDESEQTKNAGKSLERAK